MTSLWFYFILFSLGAVIFASVIHFSILTKRHFSAVIIATLTVVLLLINWNNLNQIRSEPLTFLDESFFILKHLETKDHIFLWVVHEDYDYPLTIVIPWDDETAEKLKEAEDEIEQMGIEAEMDGNSFNPGRLELYSFDHVDVITKD